MRNSLRNDNQGVALVAVLMAMLVLSILSVAVLTMTTSNLKNGLEEREFQGTYYVAEGGADYYTEGLKSVIALSYDAAATPDEFFTLIEDGRLNIPINEDTDLFGDLYGNQPEVEMTLKADGVYSSGSTSRTYIIESRGTLDGIERTVIKPITIEWKDRSDWMSDYAVFTFADMNVNGGKITGPVFSMANLNFNNGGAEIDGDVYAMGNIIFSESAKVTGDVYAMGDVIITNSGAKIGGNIYAGKKVISNSEHIEGSVYAMYSSADVDDNDSITLTNGGARIKSDAYARGNIKSTSSDPIELGVVGTIHAFDSSFEIPEEFPDGPDMPIDGSYPDFPTFPLETECQNLPSIETYWKDTPWELQLTSPRTYIPKIDVTDSRDFTIKFNDNDILMVDEFNISGNVYLEGEGTLTLYINDKLNLNSNSLNNTNSTDETEINKTSSKLKVFTKGQNVKLSGNGADLYTKLIYAPEGNIEIEGDGNIRGPVIGEVVDISGSHRSFSKYVPEAGSPDDPGTPTSADDLVIISPVKEK